MLLQDLRYDLDDLMHRGLVVIIEHRRFLYFPVLERQSKAPRRPNDQRGCSNKTHPAVSALDREQVLRDNASIYRKLGLVRQ